MVEELQIVIIFLNSPQSPYEVGKHQDKVQVQVHVYACIYGYGCTRFIPTCTCIYIIIPTCTCMLYNEWLD